MRQYDELVPGKAAEIIDAQLVAPQRRLDHLVEAEIKRSATAQGWGVFIALVLMAFSIIFFWRGNPIAGAAFIGAPFVLGAISLIVGEPKRRHRDEADRS